MGGKSQIASQIAQVLEAARWGPDQPYVEPFVGGASVIAKIDGPRLAYDSHAGLIALYNALLDGWIPPDTVTEDMYKAAQAGAYGPALTAFIGFGCSYGGRWFRGYARGKKHNGDPQNFALYTKNSLLAALPYLVGVKFAQADYRDLTPRGALVYCDPPYYGRSGYADPFDSATFWAWARATSRENIVIVSEYSAPSDWIPIWARSVPSKLRVKNQSKQVERLYMPWISAQEYLGTIR